MHDMFPGFVSPHPQDIQFTQTEREHVNLKLDQSIYLLLFIQIRGRASTSPSYHRARGEVHHGKVPSLLQR